MSKHHVIYVPGIMDDIYHAQGLLVKTWRLYGVRGHCHPMPWADHEDFTSKFQRLMKQIDLLLEQGKKVSLVGASAGASAVLNAYSERQDKITAVAVICPKINRPETVSQQTYAANPAFKTSMEQLQTNLPKLTEASKARIKIYYSPADKTIAYEDTLIPGVAQKALPKLSHGGAIIYAISLGANAVLGFLKKKSQS